MIAACTQKEVDALNPEVITATGHKPKMRVLPEGQGSFCSRYDVVDGAGSPRRVRHPLRDLRRFGFSLHREDLGSMVSRHLREWEGVPMLGPLYREYAIKLGIDPGTEVPITPQARTSFYLQFGINAEDQREFETRPDRREQLITRLAEAEEGEAPTWHRRGEIPGTTRPGEGGHPDVHLQPGATGMANLDAKAGMYEMYRMRAPYM